MAVAKKKKSKYDMSGLKGFKVTTPSFVTSFPRLEKPEAYQEGSKPAYSLVALFDEGADLTEMRKCVTRAKVEAFGKDKALWPKEIQTPWRDGNERDDVDGYEGKTYATFRTYNKPLIIDRNREKIEDFSEIYPGVIGRASIVVKATESAGKYYISFYLQGFQKIKDGERLGGGASVKDFGDIEDEDDDGIDYDDDVDTDDDEDTDDED